MSMKYLLSTLLSVHLIFLKITLSVKTNYRFNFLTFQDFKHANHKLNELHMANNLKCKIVRLLSIFF